MNYHSVEEALGNPIVMKAHAQGSKSVFYLIYVLNFECLFGQAD
jgi:hypothetical protein